jgi:hypothetical protein
VLSARKKRGIPNSEYAVRCVAATFLHNSSDLPSP